MKNRVLKNIITPVTLENKNVSTKTFIFVHMNLKYKHKWYLLVMLLSLVKL